MRIGAVPGAPGGSDALLAERRSRRAAADRAWCRWCRVYPWPRCSSPSAAAAAGCRWRSSPRVAAVLAGAAWPPTSS